MTDRSALRLALWAVALVAVLGQPSPSITCTQLKSARYPNCVQLARNVVLQWKATNDSITFNHTTLSPGLGWMGLGLSETGSMKGADMFIVQQQPNGAWSVADHWASGFQRPVEDKQQDLVLLGVMHQPDKGLLSAAYKRRLHTCDSSQDQQIVPGHPIFVQHAYGSGPLAYHGKNRGWKSVLLVPANSSSSKPAAAPAALSLPSLPQDVRTVNLSMGKVSIPGNETTYMYQWFKMPTDRKYHILSYAPLVGTSRLRFAHHAVVYACSSSMNAQIEALANKGPVVASSNMTRCFEFYMLVTPWNLEYKLPAQAGLPYGKGSYTWFMLEMHYNNPQGITGATDEGSGITMRVTPQLRPHDMGLITLAQLALVIPPGLPTFNGPTSYCNAACSRRFKHPVTLVDQTYHMHGLGKAAITRRWRGGRELAPLGQQKYFDYNYQGFVPMPQDASVLLPGDELAFTCTFDSTSRTNVTREGPGTRDEMCFHWIYYYPAVPGMGVCSSTPRGSGPKAAGSKPDGSKPAAVAAPGVKDLGLCYQDMTPLFMSRDPKAVPQLFAKGLLFNASLPSGTPYKPPACTPGLPSKA